MKEKIEKLFVGHVVETKGVVELVTVCKEITNITLKLIGPVSNEMKEKLLSIAGQNSSDWLDITGSYDYEQIIKEMLSAGVFVLPTYTEGFPNVILEAMACGSPIVATNVGAIPEMLDTESKIDYGICIKPKNHKQLKEAIVTLLDDRLYAIACGKNAQRRVFEEYAMDTVWSKLNQIWKSVK